VSRKVVGIGIVATLFCTTCLLLVLSRQSALETPPYVTPEDPSSTVYEVFPVSVNPIAKEITEDPLIDWYVREHLKLAVDTPKVARQRARFFQELLSRPAVQMLASPVSRTLVIYPGQRQEEVTAEFAEILGWSDADAARFTNLVVGTVPTIPDGKFYPGTYVVEKRASPEVVADLLITKFAEEILARYDAKIETQVPIRDALTIASLLEREAYDFNDMRHISGIIWNRLFIDMPLQLDATLQYARGSLYNEPKWWPVPVPADKFIESPYNSYQERGLPPAPIANPSLEAVVAALNPHKTECYFYFHDDDGTFYCTPNYEAHVALLKEIYGQGK
jgi:cell division protein YceG involved in septum cleavage